MHINFIQLLQLYLVHLCLYMHVQNKRIRKAYNPRGGGGGTLIFSYIRRLGPFFGVQNFEFRYFFGFSEK